LPDHNHTIQPPKHDRRLVAYEAGMTLMRISKEWAEPGALLAVQLKIPLHEWRVVMSLGTILLIILILILIGALPSWPHSRSWGYYPSGAIGVIVIILIVLLVLGRI
jgi:hypothetical protein